MSDYVVPDYVEPLEAWRVWHVVAARGAARLRSVIKPTLWTPQEPLAAECLRQRLFVRRRNRHPAPEEACDCGIYATSIERLDQYVNEALPPGAFARVVGRVALWGIVVECERGYRASHAYPVELYVPRDEELADQLAASYGIDVQVVDGLARERLLSLV